MKKLAVILTVAMATLIAVTMASAQGWGAIRGTYEMAATGGCMHSRDISTNHTYDPDKRIWQFTGSNWWTSIYVGQGTFTFDVAPATDPAWGGWSTGTMSATASCVHSNGYVVQNLVPPASSGLTTLPFYYVIWDDGTIVVVIPKVGLVLSGKTSWDHKSMTLVSTNQIQNASDLTTTPPTPIIQVCNISRVLLRVGE
jgi:hypothetical protein